MFNAVHSPPWNSLRPLQSFAQLDLLHYDEDAQCQGHRAALRECPPGPHRSTCIKNLAINLQDRFQELGILSDLDEVIELN